MLQANVFDHDVELKPFCRKTSRYLDKTSHVKA